MLSFGAGLPGGTIGAGVAISTRKPHGVGKDAFAFVPFLLHAAHVARASLRVHLHVLHQVAGAVCGGRAFSIP